MLLSLLLLSLAGCQDTPLEVTARQPPAPDAPPVSPVTASVGPVHLTQANFQAEVLDTARSGMPVLVDFWAPWCGPCRQLAPEIDAIAVEFAGRVKVGKLNVDECPLLSNRYGINTLPRVALFRGEKLSMAAGYAPQAEISAWMTSVLASDKGAPVEPPSGPTSPYPRSDAPEP